MNLEDYGKWWLIARTKMKSTDGQGLWWKWIPNKEMDKEWFLNSGATECTLYIHGINSGYLPLKDIADRWEEIVCT